MCGRPLEGWGTLAESEQLAYTPDPIEPGYYNIDWTTHWVATDDLRRRAPFKRASSRARQSAAIEADVDSTVPTINV